MSVSAVSSQMAENIQRMGDLLKNISQQETGLQDKLLKVQVTAKVAGLGENLDIEA